MKKILLRSAWALPAILLAASLSGCEGGAPIQPPSTSTPASTVTPLPAPASTSTTTHLFAFLRTVDLDPTSPQQLKAARRAAKLDHAINRQAAITANPASVDIYVWPFLDHGQGWWPGAERKITGSPAAYTSVHLSFNDRDIVYSALVNGYNQIFTATVPAEGSEMGPNLQLTSDAEHHWLPHISADGSKIVFTRFDSASNGDVVCTIDNSAAAPEKCFDLSSTTPVLKGSNIWHAGWVSSNRIVFEAWGGPLISDEIFTINSDGSGLAQITNNSGTGNYDECPSANADGTWMAVGTWNDAAESYGVDSVNLTTRERFHLAGGGGANGDAWDPLSTYFTMVWVSEADTDRSPQLYMITYDLSRLSNNSYANYFERGVH